MPALTFIAALIALAAMGGVLRLLSRRTDSPRGRRGRRMAILLVVAVVALGFGVYNAILVQKRYIAKQAVQRGRELVRQGKIEQAEEELRRAQQLDPRNKKAQEELQRLAEAQEEARWRAQQGRGTVQPSGETSGSRGHPQRRESQVRITRYDIDVTLDPARHSLAAEAIFSIRAQRGELRKFDIALSPECRVHTLTVDSRPATYQREGEWLTVCPKGSVDARRDSQVTVRYTGFGKTALLPGGDVLSPEGSYLRPESRWCPAIGYLEFRSPVSVSITVPKGQFAVAPGVLKSRKTTSDGKVKYEWSCPRNAMGVALAVGPWRELRGKVRNVQISVLLWEKHAARAEHVLAVAKQAVALFEELYGKFPYDKLAIAEIPFFPGGYSPTSLVLLGEVLFEKDSRIKKLFDAVIAHEVSHQWWGNLVLPQGPGAGWLAEGFAEYSSLLYIERTHGERAFRRALWEAKQQYHFLSQNPPEEAIIDTDPFNQQGSYTGVVYSKGAYVLHMLREVIGDEAFFATLRGFLNDHQYGVGTIAQFTAEAERHSGQDLDWFFDEWLKRTGTIELTYDWSCRQLSSGEWETTIELEQQSDPPYLVPIELQVVTVAGKTLRRGKLTGHRDNFRFVTQAQPTDIDIDPRDNLLLAVPKRHTLAQTGS